MIFASIWPTEEDKICKLTKPKYQNKESPPIRTFLSTKKQTEKRFYRALITNNFRKKENIKIIIRL